MRHWFQFPIQQGVTGRQAHADLPAGTYERELGKEGFFGPATHMLHSHRPTGWTAWDGPLKPRLFNCNQLAASAESPFAATPLLHNAAVQMRFWRLSAAMPRLARNGDGDELLFVHRGAGDLFCDYGHLPLTQGDYVVLPRSTMWRIEPHAAMELLLIEATNGSYQLPDRGLVGRTAIFDPSVLAVPQLNDSFRAQQGDSEWQVEIKRRGALTRVTYPFNPLDAVAWHGDLTPVRLNIKDIRPLMSHRVHLPPSAHTTFIAPRFVICSFVPRPFETDPGALKVPFFHNNDDYDEVLFYHDGDFFSRDHIKPGMVTLHPCGFTHGPHPKAMAGAFQPKKPATDEYAVMLDARDALEVTQAAGTIENPAYVDSWKDA